VEHITCFRQLFAKWRVLPSQIIAMKGARVVDAFH